MTPPTAVPGREQCIARAQAALSRASAETAQAYAERGAMGVAEAAYEPGGPSPEAIAQQYTALDARARRERTGAA
jgi:hypothetical protein